ncbi:MAG: histidine kinase [Bacteroidales bacterium]|nr:histidine kinase [Bacteroidales bacterium]
MLFKFITFASGFIVSLILWRVNKIIRQKNFSIYLLSVYILICSFVFAFLWLALDWIISYFFWSPEMIKENIYLLSSFYWIIASVFHYALMLTPWSLLYFLINFWIDWNEQKKVAEKHNELYNEARLIMLRYQLNPHFFFNSLNSINTLIDENKDLAKEMIYKLSDFLRYSFLSDNKLMVNLEDELTIIEKYFDIEKIRFEEKIKVIYDIGPNTMGLEIPGFILNPIVENAIKYGMRTSPTPLIISITSKLKENGLLLQISNTGKWVGEEINLKNIMSNKGVGLKNVYQRLENTFGTDFEFNIDSNDEKVQISLVLKS